MQFLAGNKTKLVCTIGPASDTPAMIEKMLLAGMNVARLNFSHGDFAGHKAVIEKIRAASQKTGRRVAIMADLPGPKMRIGNFEEEPVLLEKDATFTLTTDQISGTVEQVSITMMKLPQVVKPGDTLFLNDGLIQLSVVDATATDIRCTVIMGGELRSRKGLNIPGIDLGTSAFTPRDRECMQFALEQGVDAISQSFVNSAQDVEDVRNAAAEMGYDPFIIAKIERASIQDRIDDILAVTDGIMVARGDLGIEVPIEQIAVIQKFITARANLFAKPVITATQMLESMTRNRRPTRAESTDVANAILDGTDAVMLSEESAMGDYPIESVEMLVKIAKSIEPARMQRHAESTILPQSTNTTYKRSTVDSIAISIENLLERIDDPAAVFTPTASGYTPRSVTRFRLPVWVFAISSSHKTCQELQFSYGIQPIEEATHPKEWTEYAQKLIADHGLNGKCILQTEGPSPDHPHANNKIEIISLKQ
jgi:pyruvate kinase